MAKRTGPVLAERLKRALGEGLAAEQGARTLRTRTVVIPDTTPQIDTERKSKALSVPPRRNYTARGGDPNPYAGDE